MHFQLSWETVPGLGGMRCEGFRAVASNQPGATSGVMAECPSQAEGDHLAQALEEYFAKKRFSNGAAAFEAVKAFVLERTAERRS